MPCPFCRDCKVGLVLQEGIQRKLVPKAQPSGVWNRCFSSGGYWLLRNPVSVAGWGQEDQREFPREKGKMRKVGPSESVYDYLARGTMYISQRCSSPWMLDNRVGVSSAFQFWVSKGARSVDGWSRMKSKMLIITSAVPWWSMLEKWSPTASVYFLCLILKKWELKFFVCPTYCFLQVLHVMQ